MKYFSTNVSIVKVRRREGRWATKRQSDFLSGKLCWLFGYTPSSLHDDLSDDVHRINLSVYHRIKPLMARFLVGDQEADVHLRKHLTTAEYRIISEVASFLAIDDEGSNAPDAYLVVDLNSGRNLVLRPR